jgi:hypothetical protein
MGGRRKHEMMNEHWDGGTASGDEMRWDEKIGDEMRETRCDETRRSVWGTRQDREAGAVPDSPDVRRRMRRVLSTEDIRWEGCEWSMTSEVIPYRGRKRWSAVLQTIGNKREIKER